MLKTVFIVFWTSSAGIFYLVVRSPMLYIYIYICNSYFLSDIINILYSIRFDQFGFMQSLRFICRYNSIWCNFFVSALTSELPTFRTSFSLYLSWSLEGSLRPRSLVIFVLFMISHLQYFLFLNKIKIEKKRGHKKHSKLQERLQFIRLTVYI